MSERNRYEIIFKNMDSVKDFFDWADGLQDGVYLSDATSRIRVKSILDIFCFDLSSPLFIEIDQEEKIEQQFLKKMKNDICEIEIKGMEE